MKIQDYIFKPGSDWEAARTLAESKWAETIGRRAGVGNYVIANDKHSQTWKQQGCHYQISRGLGASGPAAIVLTEIAIGRVGGSDNAKSDKLFFLNWLLKDSHFGRFILNRDEKITDFIVISADIPGPLLQNICIISRHFAECGGAAFSGFRKMVEEGVDGHLAYPLWFNTNQSFRVELTKMPLDTHVYGEPGHRAWSLWRDVSALQNFLSGEFGKTFTQESETYREKPTIYGGVQYCYSRPYEQNEGYYRERYFTKELYDGDEDFRKELRLFRSEGSLAASAIKNPFAKAPSPPPRAHHVVTMKEMEEVVLPFMKQKGLLNAHEGTAAV